MNKILSTLSLILLFLSAPTLAQEKRGMQSEIVPCSSLGSWNPFSSCAPANLDVRKERSNKPRVKKVESAQVKVPPKAVVKDLGVSPKMAKSIPLDREPLPEVLVTMESPDDDPRFLTSKDIESTAAELKTCTRSALRDRKTQCTNVTIGAVTAEFYFMPKCLESELCTHVLIIQKWCRTLKGEWGMTKNQHVCEVSNE